MKLVTANTKGGAGMYAGGFGAAPADPGHSDDLIKGLNS